MRVIAGSARSLPLKTLKTGDTRPTTDRIKETLFNTLMPDLPGCRFLDLFAGAGAIGIEALSRGAKEAYFVEKNTDAVKIITENLKFTKLHDKAKVLKRDAYDAVAELAGNGVFDIVFIDPPYGKQMGFEMLKVLKRSGIADEDTLVVIEEDLSDEIAEGDVFSGFEIKRIKKYRSNRHIFLKKTDQP